MTIEIPKSVSDILARLKNAGFPSYVVGGCVRDAVMGVPPSDWDITTPARPDLVRSLFADKRQVLSGMKHGTVGVVWEGKLYEITTHRREGGYTDFRRPDFVDFSAALSDDLSRRDFTVNALAYSPETGITDLFGGLSDIQNKIIRCVGDPFKRFSEDALRIFRALRFAAVLCFEIEPNTREALEACSPLLKNIARERLTDEFFKLVMGKNAKKIISEHYAVLSSVLPGLIKDPPLKGGEGSLALRLSLCFGDDLHPLCLNSRLFSEVSDLICLKKSPFLLKNPHSPPTRYEVKKLLSVLSKSLYTDVFDLWTALGLPNAQQARKIALDVLEKGECVSLKTLAVNGKDLISQGFPPGKELGDTLQNLLDKVLSGALPNTRDALIEYLNETKTPATPS